MWIVQWFKLVAACAQNSAHSYYDRVVSRKMQWHTLKLCIAFLSHATQWNRRLHKLPSSLYFVDYINLR